jgi:hypothetical protein
VLTLRRAGVGLVIAVVALGLGGAIAGAKKHGFKTRVTLAHPSNTVFTGKVSSKLLGCRSQRLVNLNYTDPTTGQTLPLSVQRTSRKGKYRVNLTQGAYSGSYQAVAPKVGKAKGQRCRAGRSKVMHLGAFPVAP